MFVRSTFMFLYWDAVLLTKKTDWMFPYKENYELEIEHK